eukprot:6265581-Amphidinium_carterae.1
MERAVQTRRNLLDEHLQSVPETVRQYGGRFMEETEEVAMLKAMLQFTEQNAYDLKRVAEYEHNGCPDLGGIKGAKIGG